MKRGRSTAINEEEKVRSLWIATCTMSDQLPTQLPAITANKGILGLAEYQPHSIVIAQIHAVRRSGFLPQSQAGMTGRILSRIDSKMMNTNNFRNLFLTYFSRKNLMKTLVNTLPTSSRTCSLLMNITFALLIGIMLPLTVATTSAQLFYREYDAGGTTNSDGRCILRIDQTNDEFLSVGQYSGNPCGFALWTALNGIYNQGTTYDRVPNADYSDYGLNFIGDQTVSGSKNINSPYTPIYTGYPATGFRVVSVGSPVVLHPATWTTIIDPSNHNNKWDHVITNGNEDVSVGVGVVRDKTSTKDFFVVSHVSNLVNANLQRIGVTRYKHVNGDPGHIVDWSYEYDLDEFKLIPVGIVQANNNDIIVAGNITDTSSGPNRIFTIVLNNVTGAIVTQLTSYDATGYDEVFANSITGPHLPNNTFLVAGKANEANTSYIYPLLMELDASAGFNQWGIYRYHRYVDDQDTYLNGQFKCAKIFNQETDATYHYTGYRITAVGELGAIAPGSTQALIMNTDNLSSTPTWTKRQGKEFNSSATNTIANWFVHQERQEIPDDVDTPLINEYEPADPLRGEYVYIGTQSGGGANQAVSGGFKKIDGSSECATTPYFEYVDNPEYGMYQYEATGDYWGNDEDLSTTKADRTLSPYKCSGALFTVASGNKIRAEQEAVTSVIKEHAEITHARELLTITYTNTDDNSVKLIVTDLLGNTIAEQIVTCTQGNYTFTLSTQEFETGPYFIAVISPTSRYNKSIIIVK